MPPVPHSLVLVPVFILSYLKAVILKVWSEARSLSIMEEVVKNAHFQGHLGGSIG